MHKTRLLAAVLVAAAALIMPGTAAQAAPDPAPNSAPQSASVAALPRCAGIECSGVPTVCGRACDGKDPESFVVPNSGGWKCTRDVSTIYRKEFGPNARDGWVELRYSPSCRVAWSRGGQGSVYTGIAGFSYYSNGNLRSAVYAGGPSTPGQFYTAMLDDKNLTFKACKDTQAGGSPIWSCTKAY